MEPIRVSDSAIHQISALLTESQIADRAITIAFCTDLLPISDKLLRAISVGDIEDIRLDPALSELGLNAEKLRLRLEVFVVAQGKTQDAQLINVRGIGFALPTDVWDAIKGYLLDYRGGRFLLEDEDGNEWSPTFSLT